MQQLDYTGKASFSAIATLGFGPNLGLRIVPQPSNQMAYVEVLGGGGEDHWQLELVAADGRIVAQYTITQSSTLYWPDVAAGIYAAVLHGSDGGVIAVEKVRW